jgi:hypothetical protein
MDMKHIKYTKEFLSPIVKDSHSVMDIIRKLGMSISGGTHSHLTNKIKEYELDTSHFLRQRGNVGKFPTNKRKWQDILCKKIAKYRENIKPLRRALIESGRIHKCEECGITNSWNNKPLTLQIDHKNGDILDNTPENLRFLCPNCHSQTETYGAPKNKFTKEKIKQCKKCGKEFWYKNTRQKYCSVKCSNQNKLYTGREKIHWPSDDVLKQMIQESNYRQVSRKLGVSDNAIRKRLKKKMLL